VKGDDIDSFESDNKVYELDSDGFLVDPAKWDKDFPVLGGTCRLAGVTYRNVTADHTHCPLPGQKGSQENVNLIYDVDVRRFLIDPNQWDEYYTVHRACEVRLPGGALSVKHWGIIRFLGNCFDDRGSVPTVYENCERCAIGFEELERLFPNGYYWGVVKLSGRRVR